MNWHNPEYAWTVTSNTWLSASGECFWYHACVSKKAEIPNILQETANLSSWQCIHWRSYCWCSASGNILFPQWQHDVATSHLHILILEALVPSSYRSSFEFQPINLYTEGHASSTRPLQPTRYFASEKIQPSSDPRKIIDLLTEKLICSTSLNSALLLCTWWENREKYFWRKGCAFMLLTLLKKHSEYL